MHAILALVALALNTTKLDHLVHFFGCWRRARTCCHLTLSIERAEVVEVALRADGIYLDGGSVVNKTHAAFINWQVYIAGHRE